MTLSPSIGQPPAATPMLPIGADGAPAVASAPAPASSPRAVDLWCNAVAGGWGPEQLETGLGGGEESIVLWAEALARRGHRVRVYHNPPSQGAMPGREAPAARPAPVGGSVVWLPHAAFDPFAARDVLVTWKSPHPWRVGARAARRIHWSSDVEPPWPAALLERLDAFVAFTPYHRATMPWLPDGPARIVPLGVDLDLLERCRTEREPGLAIYASSPDRGLETVLRDWSRLRAAHPGLRLEVFYGWRHFLAAARGDPAALAFRERMGRLLAREGITERGAVTREEMARSYWRAAYWLLPLPRAESELFCLNAVKAGHCGAVAAVHRIGALRDTVRRWIDYPAFVAGRTDPECEPPYPAMGWDAVVADHWEPLFQGR